MADKNNSDVVKMLQERQKWSLNKKIDHSLGVIEQYYQTLDGRVYVAFSGGKDSTVLYWLARKIYPDIKAVFCNTRNELPEIVRFVLDMKSKPEYNIEVITPSLKPNEIVDKFGFPLVNKKTADLIYHYKKKPDSMKARLAVQDHRTRADRVALQYRYLLDAPYDCSGLCCDYLKKRPMHEYDLKNKVSPILGTMACESRLRFGAYIKAGQCNTFNNRDKRKQKSRPLSIWMEEDIWECINKYSIPICDIYYKGFDRTGCACCGFGLTNKDNTRLKYIYDNHPKMYEYFMNFTNNGVTYKDAIRELLATNNAYLPDEMPKDLFSDMFGN